MDDRHDSTRRVTVVMPARNAASTIDAQLAALAEQDFDGEIEVVVADNESDDGTGDRALGWIDRLPGLRVVPARGAHCVAGPRNAGIAAAKTPLVLVCDSDDVVDRSWVRIMVDALDEYDVVGGGIVNWDGGELPRGTAPHPFGRGGFGFLPSFGGCSFGLRRAVWEALDGFDETFLNCSDVEFAWRAQVAGYRYGDAPSAFVYYRVSYEPRTALKKAIGYGNYQPELFARYREHGMPRQPIPRALLRWAVLLLTSYRYFASDAAVSEAWCDQIGRRIGRLKGTLRSRTVYL
jgi:GT2 family glycosyltransferase